MALRNLRYDGDEILRKKAKKVKEVTKSVEILIDDMRDTMAHYNGVGIAAPQVGILKRIVIVDDDETVYEMINPEILSAEGIQIGDEGCLSMPGMIGTVERPQKLTVGFINRKGEDITLEAEGRLAVIISHEVDHLDGVMYKDKAVENTLRESSYEEDMEAGSTDETVKTEDNESGN